MKFSVSSSDLLKKLQVVGGAIGSNPVLPILEDFLFAIVGNKLTISATDLETAITTSIEVNADKEGTVAIPGKILLDTVKELPEQPITFLVDEETYGVEITSTYGKYKLAGENGQDFPRIPEPDSVEEVKVAGPHLIRAVTKTVFATSNDELRPAMTGVYFEIDANKIVVVATDAHKLVKFTSSDIESNSSSSFIVPRKALNLIKGLLPSDDMVNLAYNKSNAFFSFNNINLVCRLIDARYPDYNAVIPVDNQNKLTVPRKDLLNSLKRIAIYANKTTNQVVLSISDGSLTITSQDLDFSNEATEQQPCTYAGEPITIGFNAKFLIEMLNVLESDDVIIELANPNRAGILLPSEQEEGSELLMLVMPVMLNN